MAPLTVIDSHVHFWDPGVLEYPWLRGVPALRRSFLPADLAAAPASPPPRRVIFVECNARPDQALEEVRFAESMPEVAGIVAYGALDRTETLASRLDELCSRPRVRGVRHNIQENAPGFCLEPFFVEGVREVGRRGLSFDICATHDQLGEVAELCRRCPETRLVLDHCGKPPIRSGRIEPWADALRELASMDHVSCKVSGLFTEADPGSPDGDGVLEFARHAVECFGPRRLLYGSDWPVLTLAGELGAWYRFTLRLSEEWSEEDRRAFYHDNAVSFYRL
jgi:L-fuconolactonase